MTIPEQPERSAPKHQSPQTDRLESISRQLRTPLTDILGMAHLLNDTVLEKDQQDYVQAIMRASHELLVRVGNSLDLASLNDDTLGVSEESFGVTEALLTIVERLRPSAAARNLGISLEYAPDMDIHICCDKARLSQALYNLAASFIATHHDGALRMAARLESDKWGETLVVLITAGARSSQNGQDGNMDEALDITGRLARLMGGEVSFTSEDGLADCARLVIRVGEAENESEDKTEKGSEVAAHARSARILVAEDSRANQRLIGLILSKLGHEFELVADGTDALAAVQRSHFDMVLMDLHMPQMDGMEACRRIRALEDEQTALVPVVALSADVRPQIQTMVLEAGMDAYLSKPMDIPKLEETIHICLNTPRTHRVKLAQSA